MRERLFYKMNYSPKIFAISGGTAAGKTTFSRQLARELKAFRISHDQLLSLAYDEKTLAESHDACCGNANRLAWKLVEQLASLGIDVVLEGWGTRTLRDQIRQKATDLGMNCEFYFVSCPKSERLYRLKLRNETPAGDAPQISEEDFFRLEKLGEEFDDDETAIPIDNSLPGSLREVANRVAEQRLAELRSGSQ